MYQALNGVYLGRSSPRTLRLLANGTVLSDRTLQKLRKGEPGTRAIRESLGLCGAVVDRADLSEILRVQTRTLKHPGNHRYAWALVKGASHAMPAGLPYPKWLPLWHFQSARMGEPVDVELECRP